MDGQGFGEINIDDGSDVFASLTISDVEPGNNPSKISGKAWGRIPKFLLCKTNFPRCIYFIVGNEFCERFSYYGMKAILFMYLSRVLKFHNNTATAVFHTFSMLCYFTPLFGAMLADGWIGKYRTILYVSVIYALGNLMVSITALPPLGMGEAPGPMIGLLLIAIGTGGIKPCVSAFGGDQFTSDQEHLLQSFFSVFYFAINAGSLSSMLLTPVLRGDVECFGNDCYSLAFGVPALLMFLAIALFWGGRHGYKRRPPTGNIVWLVAKATCHALKKKMLNQGENPKPHWMDWAEDRYDVQLIDDIKAMYQVLFMFLPLPVFWTLFDQQGSRWVQQALQMDGDIGVFGTIKPDQMQALNAVFIILLIPVFEGIIYPLVKKPLPLKRMAVGMLLGALAFVIAGLVQLKIELSWRSGDLLHQVINKEIPSSFDIPSMDEIFQQLNSTIANVSIVTTNVDENLNDSIHVGVHEIDYFKYAEQFELPLVNGSFIDVALQLSELAGVARNDSPALAEKLVFLSTRHQIIHYDIIDSSNNLVNILRDRVRELEEKGNETLIAVKEINRLAKDLETFLSSDALSIANKASTDYLHRLLGWVDQYLKDAVDKYRNKVGECSQMKKVFDASASVFCDHVIGSLNAIWFSFGIISIFSLITLVLCVHLAKHYRRATRSSPKASRYSVPLSMFNRGMSTRSTKRSVNPWSNVNRNTPIADELASLRWV